MAEYGEIIDNYNPLKEPVYKMFSNYFKNPKMIRVKETDNFFVYLCKLYCLLNRECRFIIAFVDKKDDLLPIETLDSLEWVSLQTRTLPNTEYKDIDVVHGYQAVASGPLLAVIERTEINESNSTYKCNKIPIIVTLLHTEKNNKDSYQNKGTVIHALETFQTIITFDTDV
jgi:hypothetical protein